MFRSGEVDLDTFGRKTDILQINGQLLTASGKPLFCLFRLPAALRGRSAHGAPRTPSRLVTFERSE